MIIMKKIVVLLICLCLFTVNFTFAAISGDNLNELISLNIVLKDDIRENENLTYTECFNFLIKAVGANKIDDLDYEWKYRYFKKLLGNRPDWQREIICKIDSLIVLQEEWIDIDFDADCTYEAAVKFCVRAIVDIWGCVWSPAVYEDSESMYRDAINKGIIEISYPSDRLITRGEFFEILHKTIYAEHMRGGYGGTWKERIIDRFTEEQEEFYEPEKPTYEEIIGEFIAKSIPASKEEIIALKNQKVKDFGLSESFPESVDTERGATRAELAVIISRLMGYNYAGSFKFEDFDYSKWYGDDFSKAAFCHILVGYENYVRPDDLVTPYEARIMLSRAFMTENFDALVCENEKVVTFNEIFSALDNMVNTYYNLPRSYDNENAVINGNVFVASPNIVLKNTVINGNLYITANPAKGLFSIENVMVNGDIILPCTSSGEKIHLLDCSAKNVKSIRSASGISVNYSENSPMLSDSGKNGRLNDDLSLSWEFPDNMLGIGSETLYAYDEDNKKVSSIGRGLWGTKSDDRMLLGFVLKAYPKKLDRVEVVYGGRNPLTINTNNITVKESGRPLIPDIMTEIPLEGVTLKLAEGEFKAGSRYLVTRRCEDEYDPDEIITTKAVYIANESGKACFFDNFFGYIGGGSREGISIQEISISGNAKNGFLLNITPESKETFFVDNFKFTRNDIAEKHYLDDENYAELFLGLPVLEGRHDGINSINEFFAAKKDYFCNQILDVLKDDFNLNGIEGARSRHFRSAYYRLEARFDSVISISAELNGGAGGVSWAGLEGNTFDIDAGEKLVLSDIFSVPEEEYMGFIYSFVSNEVEKKLQKDEEYGYFFNDPYSEDGKNYIINGFNPDNFYLTPKRLVIFYDKYELAHGAAGVQIFEIPYESIKELIKNTYIFEGSNLKWD